MLRLVLLIFATFWAWETLRFILQSYVSTLFDLTRSLHPFLVAALPLWVLWPDWISALAVAGATGILHLLVERFLIPMSAAPMSFGRRRPRGLPPLP